MTLSRKSVIAARPSRLSRNRAMPLATDYGGRSSSSPAAVTLVRSGGESSPREIELARSRGDGALEGRTRGAQEVVEVREDDRGLVEQELLDLPGEPALGFDV